MYFDTKNDGKNAYLIFFRKHFVNIGAFFKNKLHRLTDLIPPPLAPQRQCYSFTIMTQVSTVFMNQD